MHPKGNHPSKFQLAGVRRFGGVREQTNKQQTDSLTHSLTDWFFYRVITDISFADHMSCEFLKTKQKYRYYVNIYFQRFFKIIFVIYIWINCLQSAPFLSTTHCCCSLTYMRLWPIEPQISGSLNTEMPFFTLTLSSMTNVKDTKRLIAGWWHSLR